MLTLPIKKKWFDMIKSGEKKEEYREIKRYYDVRLGNSKRFTTIIFRNGYLTESPKIKCNVEITIGYGKEEWGAEPNKAYYVLKILSVEEMK
mgnify:CR=1 FL=1